MNKDDLIHFAIAALRALDERHPGQNVDVDVTILVEGAKKLGMEIEDEED